MVNDIIKVAAEAQVVGIEGRAWLMVPVREGFLDKLSVEYAKLKTQEAQQPQ